MKIFRLSIIITLALTAGSVTQALAQNNDHKTNSARAAYGLSPAPSKHKKKSKKKHKIVDPGAKLARDAREKKRALRKRNNWAS
jgi:hypothetical protein